MTFNRSEIMKAAWAICRRANTFNGRFVYGRRGPSEFAKALKQAWRDTKAAVGKLAPEQIVRDRRAATIRQQIDGLQWKSWRFDYAGARQRLETELAAVAD